MNSVTHCRLVGSERGNQLLIRLFLDPNLKLNEFVFVIFSQVARGSPVYMSRVYDSSRILIWCVSDVITQMTPMEAPKTDHNDAMSILYLTKLSNDLLLRRR